MFIGISHPLGRIGLLLLIMSEGRSGIMDFIVRPQLVGTMDFNIDNGIDLNGHLVDKDKGESPFIFGKLDEETPRKLNKRK